jgi:thiol:disulfide interchange protein
MDTTDRTVRSGPQSRLPPILFWLVVAAIVFRIVTALAVREKKEDGAAGLVRWRPHEKAAAAARSEGKPVLYDFTAAWCQPCHSLDTEGWGDSRIASLVNGSYLPARVVDREREDGKNPAAIEALQRRYSVRAFPTLVVADADGREIAKTEGYAGKERLVRFLEDSRGKARAR